MNRENIENIYRLSPIQQGMLFHTLYSPQEGVYFEQFNVRFDTDFDPATFERVWQEVVDRHTVLRTAFAWEGLEEPVQIVHRRVKLPIEVLDWRGIPETEQEARLQDLLAGERRRGFDLAQAPLLRFCVLRLRDDLHHVAWSYHHAVLDGWSAHQVLEEVDARYRASFAGQPAQVPPRRPFRDYIAWLRQQDTSQTEAYWRRELGGFTAPTPLGIDRPPSRGRGEDLGRDMKVALLPEGESEALKTWARAHRLTLSTVVQGAWALVLSRYSGESDLVYGLTVSGRPPSLPGVETMLGCFINTLPVRVRVPAGEGVRDWLQALQAGQVELRRYEHSPLVQVLGWSDVPRPTPLFESIFVFEGFSRTAHEGVFQRTNYPLTLVSGLDGALVLRADYERERFEPAAIERLLGHLQSALRAFLARPEGRLEEIDLLTPGEREQLLAVWNPSTDEAPEPRCLHEIFAEQAARSPDAPAVTFEGETRTYRELDQRANRLAHHLRRRGVGPDVRVGLCVDRSLAMIEGLLGILKAGGAYVPLDPRYPAARLAWIAEDSGLAALVTVEPLHDLVPVPVETVVCLDTAGPLLEMEPATAPESGARPDNLAYVIYTSGSTGRPKGSLITHGNVTRLFTRTDPWYGFGPDDVWTLFHSFAFDFSVWEIWGALLYGGRLVIVPWWVSRSPEAFHDLLVRERVAVLNQTPSAFRQLVQADLDAGEGDLALRLVIFGGEALEPASLAPWFDRHGDRRPVLVNMYGITETTVHVTYREVSRADLAEAGRSPVGVPIPDLRVHLLDRHLHLVPVGVPGEMFVAGAGLARGYLGRPDLTAERFVPDPFGRPGERLYRSGDLARRLPDGDLEYLGRIDHQVKIRGFRIELGEIEAALASHPDVREAVALLREDPSGDRRLVAWVVPRAGAEIETAELRSFLKDRLPDYMVPAALVEIPAVPLTAHGKVDRRALPDPAAEAAPVGEGYEPPRTPTEELLAGIWSEVLGAPRVGRHDGFFDLGGHSLLATRVLSRLREVFQVDLPLWELFEAPTVAELAQRVEAARASGGVELPPLAPSPREGLLPLSFSQERLWFLDQLEPGSDVYNVPSAVRLTGALDAAALRRALAEVVRRHEALRTVFAVHAGRPAQVVREDLRPPLPLVDLTALPEPTREAQVRRLLAEDSRRPFDLAAGPLLRHALVRVGEGEHVVLLTFHHIVSDAGSIGTFVREVAALYAAFMRGLPSPLPELPVQYADFARWQRQWLDGAVLDTWLGWWRERLAGVPVLQLPGDRPRPAVQSFRGGMCPFALSEELSASLRALARARGATLFMTLLAAFEALLSRYSGQEDFAVGSPVAGRDRRETEDLIGFFVNTLVLRAPLGGSPDFKTLLDRVRAGSLEAYAHQGVPFERIVQELAPERNLSSTPLFQIMLAFQTAPQDRLELPGLTLTPITDQFSTSKFDLSLMAFDAGPRISGQWVYATSLFDAETIARWAGHFQVFLAGLAADPGRRISELPLLTQDEREQVLVEWNRPAVDHPEGGFVHQLFEEQVARTPDAVAVVFEGETLSYRELNARANRLARRLRRLGAGPEVLVGISAERSFEMVVGLLAILKAGSAYVPLDPSLPAERLAFMIEDAGIGLLLTQEQLLPPADESPDNPAFPVFPENPAYVIYTSGSTGQPKGVVVSHGALGNRLQYARAGDVLETEVLLQKATISFDVSVLEIFGPLVTGGRTVLARPGGQQDTPYLVRLIQEQRVTYIAFPPSLLSVLFEEEDFDRCDSLRIVLTGAETVPAVLPRQFYETLPGADLLNRYGPTEATISITSWVCERDATPRSLPIGRPMAKGRVYLLDRALQPVPVGIAGEIFLGGPCVARGYLRRPALTAAAFVPDPFSGQPGARLYRTGDLARYRPDGALEFVGRVDHQVKIRGFRVELGEIEAALARHPAVREVAVVDREDGPTRSLAAYLALQPGSALDETDLRSFLLASLPAYMVPADFVALDALPLSPTGKVDRKALPAPRHRGDDDAFEAPRTPTEELLATVWAGLLSLERVGIRDSFFDLGGHSLLATQAMSRVREAFGVELPLRLLFEKPTVAALAAEIDAAVGAGAGLAAPPLLPVTREGDLPLSFAQERLWFLDRLQPMTSTYNLPVAVRLHGPLSPPAFAAALREVARRHESLRTTFGVRGDRPVQRIAPALDLPLPLVDLSGLPEAEREAAARQLATEESRRPFDLAAGPLLRTVLIRLRADEHLAVATMHHIVSDGWSVGVLIRELGVLYGVALAGMPSPLPELPLQPADFARWQRDWLRGDVLESEIAWWRERLAGAPPLLDLPADRPRPAVQRFRGASLLRRLPADLSRDLKAFCRETGVTPFMALLAGFQALLHRYTGRRDLLVGTPVAGRTRLEVENLIGFFLNNLVLRTDLGGDPQVCALAERTRETALAAYAHQDLPFEKLVEELSPERSLSHAPLFQVMLVFQNTPRELPRHHGVTFSPVELEVDTAKLDLTLNARETERGLILFWLFNRDLFDAATVDRLSSHLETLLAAAVADPGRRLSELPLLTPQEEEQLLEWNDTAARFPTDVCLHELVEAALARAPERIAVTAGEGSLTARALNAAANRLAHRLAGLGVGPEVPVGVFAERSLEMVVALLAVLKAGGAYLPLDPDHPEDRVAWMLEDSEVPVVLTQPHLAERLPGTQARVVLLDCEDLAVGEETAPASGVQAGNLAYVIYTSGSTGRPKGTMNTHRGIVNRLLWMQQEYGLTPDDRVLQKTPYSFDVSVWEFFWPLLTGARLVMARPGGHQDAAYLVRTIQAEEITTLHFVPSMLQVFLDAPGVEGCVSLARVIASGEALPLELQRRFFRRLGAGLHNLYGPTEAAVDVTYWPCEAAGRRGVVPIGRPVANTRIHLLDANLWPVPVGVPGELHIGGVQVGRGYLGRPELTAERFIPDPFSPEPGARLYKTGDLARHLPDGAIDFLGRIDHQVKLRGLRIELGEIETAIAAHPAVREAVVLARAERSGALGGASLVAYLTKAGEDQPAPAELRALLARSLPEYMIPSAWVVLEALPLSPNGKVDRKALARIAPERGAGMPAERIAPRTELERALAALWSESLGLSGDRFGIHDNFFELGGNSITGAILVNRLQEILGEIVHVVTLFDAPTIAGLAARLAAEYPESVARIWGPDSLGETGAAAVDAAQPVDEGKIEEVRRRIRTLTSREPAGAPRNPPAVFVLSPPRSGTTLLRVMLGGNPRLFAPPELELLNFDTLAERRDAFAGRDAFRLEGLLRAVMEVRGCGPDEAREIVEGFTDGGMTTRELYRTLQEWIGDRLLVDKTPTYAWDPATLRRAEEAFEGARYIHLVRHPYGMIRSFEEARIDQIFFPEDHPFTRRELAEILWVIAHRNILDFLDEVPRERQLTLRFEDLLADPEAELRRICDVLNVEYHPDMAEPYKDKGARMTDGLHAASRMLGDVKFHEHRKVEAGVADRWKEEHDRDFLGDLTWQLAARLGFDVETERVGESWAPLAPGGWREGEPLPLSFAQERLWFFDQMEPGSPAYHIPAVFRLAGRLDVAALEASFREIVRRHASLRTTLSVHEGEPVQIVSPWTDLRLPLADLGGLPVERREAEARSLAGRLVRQPFDLSRGPVLRATLLRLGSEEHAAVFTLHHIAGDGWSMGVLVREVAALYRAFSQGLPSPLPELPIQYPDHAIWQRRWLRGERLEAEISFWKESLASAPVLELPTDRARPPLQTYRGSEERFFLPAALAGPLTDLGRAGGATPFMVLLAGFATLLARYSGQDDVSIGSPVANRNRAQTEPLIGFFVNTLVFRTDLSGGAGFRELLGRVRRTALAAYAHQELPFERVVEEVNPPRDLSRSPLFQVLLALQNAGGGPLELPGLALLPLEGLEKTIAKFDLTLWLTEAGQGITASLEYNRDLFDAATITRMIGHFRTLLEAAAASPERPVSELPLLTPAEIRELAEANATVAAFPEDATLHRLFEEQAARTPDRPAVTFRDETLSYRTLNERANRLAHTLRATGVGPEDRVGICVERSLDMAVAVLGVLKAGGAYVPLDPGHPRERLAYVLRDAGAAVLLTQESVLERLPGLADGAGRVLRFDRDGGEIARHSSANPTALPLPADRLAYAIYTSGSTGQPKGVQIPHRALVNFLVSMRRRPGLAEDDALLAVTTLSFDIAGLELFLPLLSGARVIVAPAETVGDGAALARLLKDSGATVLQATPATWRLLLESGWEGDPGLRILCGGEALPRALAERLLDKGASLWNLYGPTETTVWSAVDRVQPGTGPVSLGGPIANTGLHLLDRAGQPVPAGVPGELFIGGDGVARGYLGRPALTAERFVPDPFASAPGARMYRTGDLLRRRADGALEFLGRIDHQVKVRGFRIELGEIEAVLTAHPEVREAVVLARGLGADVQLAAYVVPIPGSAPTLSALREFLTRDLPDYMLPSALAVLDAFPLNPNGKVDRKALSLIAPERVGSAPEGRVAPRTSLERFLAGLWSEALGGLDAGSFGIHDNFFELGGNSIAGAILVNRLQQALQESLRVVALFHAPTIAGLAAHVAAEHADAVARVWGPESLVGSSIAGSRAEEDWAPLEPGGWREGEPLPLSFSQERLWFFDQMEPGSPAYHIPAVFRLAGALDVAALAASLREIVRRHAALRTTFSLVEGAPVQIVAPRTDLRLPVVDLGALPPERREAEARSLAGGLVLQPFDLRNGPVLRAALLRLGPEEHAAVFTMHHIVSDGWSMGVLVREVAATYGAAVAGEPSPLPGLPIQYPDYALWQRRWLQGEALERQIEFWKQTLAGAPTLQLPTDRPRPRVQTYRGGTRSVRLPAELSAPLVELGRQAGATLFMTLLAGYATLLARWSGTADVSIGSPVANRTRTETEPLIGLFINMVVLRNDTSGDPGFRDLLARIRTSALAAFLHQDMPFATVVESVQPERDLSRSPLFQVMLVLQNARGESLRLPGLVLEPLQGVEGSTSKVDLTLSVLESPAGLVGWLYYNHDLFDAATVDRLAGHLGTLLAAAVADPGRRISELPLLTPPEKRQLLAWNATAAEYPADVCLHELIAAQVEKTPGRIAVTSEGEALTFRGLSAAAGRLARQLRELGVGPEVPVGVCAERSLELVVALLAILQAGGAYVPLDSDDPAERLAHALTDSGVPVLLTQERLLGRLPAHGARTLLIDGAAVEKGDAAPPPPNEASGVGPGNLAYVIYTSGSTGKPKGTMNTHRGIVNRLLWMQETYGLGADDRVLQKTPFSFDVSVWEFFWPLLTGARLVMARPGGHKDSGYLVRTIVAEEITTLHFVPSMLQVFVDAPGGEGCASLQRVICSGEALPADLQRRFFSRLGARLYNLYGPTEAAVDVTCWTCERAGRRGVVPIGHPVANTQIWLLDASLHQVPVGVSGELHIGGVQVGRGYWNRPDLTAERFIPDPFSPEPGARLYKTGDLARRLPDGAVDFLGRIDHQVKVRGLRIELGEIEVALAAQPSIREAVVLARRPEGSAGTIGAVELVAYVIPAASGNGAAPAPTLAGLRESLARSLPEHMLPTALVVLDAFPLTSSGKTDRRALSRIAPERTAGAPAERVAPRTELERFLAGLWSETLGGLPAESFGIHDSFFDLGGNSITGAILVNRLQKTLGEIVHVVAIFDTPTIAGLADWLAAEYPDAVARIWGADSLGEAAAAAVEQTAPLDEGRIEQVRRMIPTLQGGGGTRTRRNPPAVFVLSPPRSGSTLLRVMLGGNPRLFAPPELELLNFNTLAERRDAFPGRNAFRLEGLLRAVMEVRGGGPDEAREIVDRLTDLGLTTRELYRCLQEWIDDRLLVDKTPTYAWDPATLRRAEEAFKKARYIHLVRHPYGMVHSFEEARIDQIFFHEDHPFTRRELAEALWVIAHRNILDFLDEVPGDRQLTVRFEDLLADPESELRRICDVLGVDYHPDMAVPYKKKGARMTDGLHAESRMLGDVKFHEHKGVERGVAERWRESYRRDFLGDVTWRLAARLGYDVERERVGASRIPSSLVKLRPGTTRPPLFLVHPVSGELLLYRHLVNALGPDREVYGFQAQGFHEGEQPLETLEEMADLYVEALRAVQPAGPCLLAGSSMGGLLAFEMARRLRSLGREVALTALLDAPDPAVMARESRDAEGLAELDILRHATGGKEPLVLEDLRGLTPDQRLDLLLDKGREAGGFGAGMGPAELHRLVRLVEANRRALRAYHPEPADLRIVYIRAAQGVRADAAWEPLALGGVEVHEVPGSHLSMHLPPHAAELAEILVRTIGERLEETHEEDTAVAVAEAGQEVEVGELGLES